MLPDNFQIDAVMSEACPEPLEMMSVQGSFIHQEKKEKPTARLHFFKMDLDENIPIKEVNEQYMKRGLRPLPPQMLEIFFRVYPTFACGYKIGTQYELQKNTPQGCETGTAVRLHEVHHEGNSSGSHLKGLLSYKKCTIWFVGRPNE